MVNWRLAVAPAWSVACAVNAYVPAVTGVPATSRMPSDVATPFVHLREPLVVVVVSVEHQTPTSSTDSTASAGWRVDSTRSPRCADQDPVL
jgi:hypothetical protein